MSLGKAIQFIVDRRAGVSDCDLAFAIYGKPIQQIVNGECRHLASTGKLVRRKRPDGIIGNYLPSQISS